VLTIFVITFPFVAWLLAGDLAAPGRMLAQEAVDLAYPFFRGLFHGKISAGVCKGKLTQVK
jgi:hypothetical protein